MSVSLCLIVKDEEGNLKKCLASFRSVCDEIIVVDTGSKDTTKQIAKRCGAKVFDYKWRDDFSAARNFAISKATKKWIMMVDADDVIKKSPLRKIKMVLKTIPTATKVVFLPYIYTQTDVQKGQTAWLPRLWRRSMNLKYVFPIHEYLDLSKVNFKSITKVNAPIVHRKLNQDYRPGLKRNLKILIPAIKKKTDDLRILYYLVHDHRHLGKFKEALHWCEKYFEAKPKDSIHLGKVFTMQGMCYLGLNKPSMAQFSFLLAIGANPLLIEPYLELGDLHYRQKRYEEAIHMYRLAETCNVPPRMDAFFNQAVYDYSAERKLAYILAMVGKNNEALRYAQKVLKFTPNDAKLKAHIKKLKKTNV